METVTLKTCSELQEYVWLDGALVSLADLNDAQRKEMAARSEQSRMLPTPRIVIYSGVRLQGRSWMRELWMEAQRQVSR